MHLYELDNIAHGYGHRPVLTIDRLTLPAGAILGLSGPNGSGKSTLLRLLGFVARPDSGTIRFNGHPAAPFDDRVRGAVALLPQTAYLLRRSVSGNVAYGLRLNGKRPGETDRIREALTLVGLDPDIFARRPWFALSGGEARRVALASRLALHPRVLLMDEPTTSVDAASAQRIKVAALEAHRQWGTSLIIASHDHLWLQDICHDTLHLFRGRLLGQGRCTLVFGPWRRRPDGSVATPLAESRNFVASQAPADLANAVAAIDARRIALHGSPVAEPGRRVCLEGTVVALGLEKATDQISVDLAVGQTLFTVCLERTAAAAGRFMPGGRAWLTYFPDDVRWY